MRRGGKNDCRQDKYEKKVDSSNSLRGESVVKPDLAEI